MITNEHPSPEAKRTATKVEAPPAREEREVVEETEVAKQADLCVNCRHRLDCQYRKPNARPVIFCEEFEIEETPSRPSRKRAPEAAEAETTGSLKGLCMNCAHRKTCRLPKPEGGVWHCEEYA